LDGETGYETGYDGYTFYQEMSWSALSTIGDARGLLSGIPEVGYTGWVCYFRANNIYECSSRFLASSAFKENEAPDYETTAGASTGWFCSVNQATLDQARCFYYMPIEATSYD